MTDPAAGRPPRAAIRGTALPTSAPAPAESGAPSAQAGTVAVLRTENLTRHFKIGSALSRKHSLHAVDDFSLTYEGAAPPTDTPTTAVTNTPTSTPTLTPTTPVDTPTHTPTMTNPPTDTFTSVPVTNTPTQDATSRSADINEDGTVNELDLYEILRCWHESAE